MDKRVEKNKSNVLKLESFYQNCVHPAAHKDDQSVLKALASQGNFAKYENKEQGIEASSLNTLKRTCEKIFDNGFDELDKLRVIALEKLTDTSNEPQAEILKIFILKDAPGQSQKQSNKNK